MSEYINATTDVLGGSVIRYNLNTTTPNQAVIRKIIAGNGIIITSTGVDAGTGDVTISVDVSGSGGSGGGTGGGTGGGGTGGGSSTSIGTVTSVNMTVPQGLTVLGAPITTAGTLSLQLSSGYTIPLYVDVQKGVDAFSNKITSIGYNTSTGVVTMTQYDGGTLTTTITLSPFTTSNLSEGTNLYYTDARARGAISLTTTGTSGNASYSSVTGVLNIPNYTETDTLDSVTTRGNTTNNGVTINGTVNLITTLGGTNVLRIGHQDTAVAFVDIRPSYLGPGVGLYVQNPGITGTSYALIAQAQQVNAATNNIAGYFNAQGGLTNVAIRTDYGTNVLNALGGNLLVGTTTDGIYKVDINGNLRTVGGVYAGTFAGIVNNCLYTYITNHCGSAGYIGFGFNNTTNPTPADTVFEIYQGLAISPVASLFNFKHILSNTLGNFDQAFIGITGSINQSGSGTGTVRGIYYNPTLTSVVGVHYAWESTSGKIKVSDLIGTGTRMVVADSTGVLSTQAIPTGNPGTVTSVSVVSANGFAGTVANNSTTPAITLSTTITGMLKGNGTAISAAVSGTDYQAPIALTTTGNSGPATFVGDTLNIPVYTNITDGLVSGGIVTWSGTGFIYDVSAAYYYLGGVYYTTSNTQVTLGAADVSNPRIDIVAVNNLGQVIVIPGVPGSNPVKAQIDPTTQIELATILVPAGATSPVNILTAILYDEVVNSTWSSSASGVTVDFANATTPYTGSVTASVNATTTGTRFIQFTRITGTDSVSNYSVFKFAIRLGTAWTSTSTLAIGFYNNNTLISTEVSVLNGAYGFNMATTATYQLIQIPIANWRFTQATFNRVRFRFINSLPAFRLDRVELQAGVVQTLIQANNIYTSDGSLAGIRTLTLNGNYLDIVGSSATTRFNSDGSLNIGGTVTATTLASGADKLVLASATGVLSAVTIGTGLSYSAGILTATGTLTSASFQTDYDDAVTGLRNSVNTVYTTSQNFVSGSTRVFVNGVRQSRGGIYDYTETAANQITFNYAPDNGDLIVIDYIKS